MTPTLQKLIVTLALLGSFSAHGQRLENHVTEVSKIELPDTKLLHDASFAGDINTVRKILMTGTAKNTIESTERNFSPLASALRGMIKNNQAPATERINPKNYSEIIVTLIDSGSDFQIDQEGNKRTKGSSKPHFLSAMIKELCKKENTPDDERTINILEPFINSKTEYIVDTYTALSINSINTISNIGLYDQFCTSFFLKRIKGRR